MKAPEKVSSNQTPGWRWIAPDHEWLEYHHRTLGKSARQIASEVGCSGWKAQEWIRDMGWREPQQVSSDLKAPRKIGSGCGSRFVGVTRDWLYREYVERDKSAKQIADEIGTTHHTVWQWLLKHDIPTRTREEMSKRHAEYMLGEGSPSWNGGISRTYQIRLLEQSSKPKRCAWCGASGLDGGPQGTMGLQVHHLDHDPMNGDLDNLEWLCGPCNRLESHIKALEDAGRAISIMFEGALHVYFTEHNQ